MRRRSDRDPFEGMRVPGPPEDLARRVLDAAAGIEAGLAPATIWDRLWESHAVRRTWAVATLGLLLAHVGLTLAPRGGSSPTDARRADRRQVREVREQLALPVVEISPRAEAIALGSGRPRREPDAANASGPADRS